jgi:hypothetical protein
MPERRRCRKRHRRFFGCLGTLCMGCAASGCEWFPRRAVWAAAHERRLGTGSRPAPPTVVKRVDLPYGIVSQRTVFRTGRAGPLWTAPPRVSWCPKTRPRINGLFPVYCNGFSDTLLPIPCSVTRKCGRAQVFSVHPGQRRDRVRPCPAIPVRHESNSPSGQRAESVALGQRCNGHASVT